MRDRRGTDVSLRAFHLLFIALSVVLAAFIATWAVGQYRAGHDAIYAVTTAAACVLGVALTIYGAGFQRKTRNMS